MGENRRKRRSFLHMEHWQVINTGLVIYDILAVNAAFFLALWLRFDCHYSLIPTEYLDAYMQFAPFYTIASILVFYRCRLYQSIWRFASYSELLRAVMATIVTGVVQLLGTLIFVRRMPISYYLFGIILQFFAVLGIRFSYRLVLLMKRIQKRRADEASATNVMIVGAGAAGQTILKDLSRTDEVNVKVCCFIDDNPNKWNRYIEGVPVVGGRDDILKYANKMAIDRILFAIPSISAENKREILNICKETGCELKALPAIYQLVNGEVNIAQMKDVTIDDLLGRPPIETDMQQVYEFLQGKKVLITGAGGSIGSVAALQVAGHNPKQLILFDMYENNIYDVEHEVRTNYPDLDLVVLIGSVRDSRRINQVFETYKPEVVYHAAAHKHVPLMEASPNEAIKNNAIGTYKTAYAAMVNGCQRFVLISTDKAVNPTNIMGASKRLCEMIIQTFDHMVKEGRENELPRLFAHAEDEDGNVSGANKMSEVKTEFVAVRFGNVLGSNGSVIPLFKKQIANGGPVTVTHPDIIRYFMTIPEAVSLVLQAGTYAKGGEIFVLDMGSPVKIDTLARNLIKLSGFKPDVDIKIEYTGLRPGEKLYEEKLMAEEGLKSTPNSLIHIGCPIPFDMNQFIVQLNELMVACYENRENIREMVEAIVPTYHPAGEHGSERKGEAYEAQRKQMEEK
ncbi:MAG: polysaccharide biosynthesis protein [Tyzzerella sp.]|nr:polysaccharide biosynthesis protein [Tyzzerella sp.]